MRGGRPVLYPQLLVATARHTTNKALRAIWAIRECGCMVRSMINWGGLRATNKPRHYELR